MKYVTRLAPCLAVALLLLSGTSVLSRKSLEEADSRTPVPLTELIQLPDEKSVLWGKEVDGLACRILATTEAVAGQPVRFTVQVRNNSPRVRYIYLPIDIHIPEITRLNIAAPDGKPLRLGSWGSSGVAGGLQEAPAPNFKALQPGETRRIDFGDLGEYFHSYVQRDGKYARVEPFATQGKYTLKLSYRSPKCAERYATGQRAVVKEGKQVVETTYENASKEVLAGAFTGTLESNEAAVTIRPMKADDLTLHEWGVFTVFNDLKLANANRKAEWGSLPPDFYRQFPERRLRWQPAAWDKPIVYFYTKQPSLRIDVQVRFTDGAPVVWWPACADPIDNGMGQAMPANPQGAKEAAKPFNRLHWVGWLGNVVPPNGCSFGPDAAWVKVKDFELPKDSWLHDARLKDPAPFSVVGSKLQRGAPWTTNRPETERFIYYDGLVPAPDYLRCVKVTDTAITVKNTSSLPLGQLFLVDRRADRKDRDGAVAYRAEPIAPGKEVEIPTEVFQPARASDDDALTRLGRTARKSLLDAGLFEAEADSLLKLWRKDFFEAGGVTAFYLLPQQEYDRMLPLEVTPKPAERLVRVGVAHHPAFENGPRVRQRVATLIQQLDSQKFAERDAASRDLEQLGPWAVPQMREALAGKPSLETSKRLERLLEKADASEWLRQALPPAK
jgi:hypothetical protein